MVSTAVAIDLVCKLCEHTYQYERNVPIMLPCLHSFCKSCVTKYVQKKSTASNTMSCPTCNDLFPFPTNISHFPVNLHLLHLAKATAYEQKVKEGTVKCQKCKSATPNNATSFAYNRCIFLCDECKRNYQHFRDDEDEKFIDLTNYEKGDFVKEPSLQSVRCSKHVNECIELFCHNCMTLVCSLCSQTEHDGHKRTSCCDMSKKKIEKEFHQLTNGIDDVLCTINQTLQQIEDMKDKVKVSTKEATTRIDEKCDELIQAVENRRKILKKKCEKITKGKNDVLSSQIYQVQRLKKNLLFAQRFVKDALLKHSIKEILSVKKAIEDRLKQLMETYERQPQKLTEDDYIGMSMVTDFLLKEIKNLGTFPGVPDPSKCYVEGIAVPTIGVDEEKKIAVVLRDEMQIAIQREAFFQYEVCCTSKYLQVPPKITVSHPCHEGIGTLGFTPDQQGEYEVTVMVQNEPITNPLVITARKSINYRRCFPSMKATYIPIKGKPCGVAVHENGTVYASDYSAETVLAFKTNGSPHMNFKVPVAKSENLSKPMGVVLIDNILLVVSNGSNVIKKYSTTNGKFIGEIGKGYFSSPYGICSDGKKRVLVADQYNQKIHIFTLEGEFIKSFQCTHYPYDVAVDPIGNVHVALYKEHHIAVYSQSGRKLETYNLQGSLRYPTGISIDGAGTRVISTDDSKVHIADSNGKCIAHRVIKGAWGVTIDKNGVIYVAEYGNSRLSVY